MFHKSIAPPTGTWRRIRAALARQSHMSRPLANEPTIHPAWCTCSDCDLHRRRGFTRTDLIIIGIALLSAAVAAGGSWLMSGGR